MHGTGVKMISAQQAKLYNTYKNSKLKFFKTNAAIYEGWNFNFGNTPLDWI